MSITNRLGIFELLSNEKVEWKTIRLGSGFCEVPDYVHRHISNIAALTRKSNGEAAALVLCWASQSIDEIVQEILKTVSDIFTHKELDAGTFRLIVSDEQRKQIDDFRKAHFEQTNEWLTEQEAGNKALGLGLFELAHSNFKDVRDYIPGSDTKATTRKIG